jgi:ABC-type phosphate/phosphonate transport system substrate-binding protein
MSGRTMKKQIIMLIPFILLASLGMLFIPAAAKGNTLGAKPLHLKMGVVALTKSNNDIFAIERDVFDAFNDRYAIEIKQEIYSDINVLRRKINENKIDLFACWNTDCDVEFHKSSEYAPMFITTAFETNSINMCLITRKEISPDSVDALKGKTIIINGDAFSYYSLKKLIGSSPDEYFAQMASKPDTMSNIYAVSMGAYDATFVNSGSLKTMKFVNPGPLKKINKSVCGEPYKSPAVYASNKIEPALKDKILKDMVEITSNPRKMKKDPEFKEFWPMLNKYMPFIIQTKAKFIPVTSIDYDNVYNLFKEAEKKGWDKDYKKWKRFTEEY